MTTIVTVCHYEDENVSQLRKDRQHAVEPDNLLNSEQNMFKEKGYILAQSKSVCSSAGTLKVKFTNSRVYARKAETKTQGGP